MKRKIKLLKIGFNKMTKNQITNQLLQNKKDKLKIKKIIKKKYQFHKIFKISTNRMRQTNQKLFKRHKFTQSQRTTLQKKIKTQIDFKKLKLLA